MSLRTSAGIAQVRHLCLAFGLSRAALYKAAAKSAAPANERRAGPVRTTITNEALMLHLTELTTAHPACGHRKVWAMLRRREVCVARRRVWALMHQAGLTFAPSARRCEPRRGSVAVELPNRRWSTDMTTTWTRKDGWVALTPVIDNGHAVAERVIQTMKLELLWLRDWENLDEVRTAASNGWSSTTPSGHMRR